MSQSEFSGALEAVLQRDAFYYQSYRKNMFCLFLLIIIISVLITLNILFYGDKPRPIYFATTASGEILELTPITERSVTDEQLVRWAAEAIEASYNYNFVNYRQVFQNARPYYTAKGHNEFLDAIKQSLNLNRVKQEKLLFASIISDVSIEDQGQLASGTYYWDVKIPMKVGLLGGVKTKYEGYNWVVKIKILRMSPLQNTSGLGIAQTVVTEG
jgi:intracellular multiplication protein IcmL